MSKEKTRIEASERSFSIIDTIVELDQASASQIADHLDLPRSTAHYHLKTLEDFGLVEHEEGKYRTSMKFLTIGHESVKELELYEVGKSKVDELAKDTGELCILMVEERGQAYYIYDSKGKVAVDFDTIGLQKNLHDNALGKSVLAHMSSERVDKILDRRGMPASTKKTVTDRTELKEELADIRSEGVAYDRGEQVQGLQCVAAPILFSGSSKSPDIKGAISIAGPVNRLAGDYLTNELAKKVSDAANIIELEMTGY